MRDTAMDAMQNPISKYLTLAGMAKKFADMAIGCYIPIYMMHTFPHHKTQYAMLNALILGVLGLSSNIIGGFIGDRLGRNSPLAKNKICIWSALIQIPLVVLLMCGGHGSFLLSMIGTAINVSFAGTYNPNAISILQSSATKNSKPEKVLSAYWFFTHISEMMTPIIFSVLLTMMGGSHGNPSGYGNLIKAFTTLGFSLTAFFSYQVLKE